MPFLLAADNYARVYPLFEGMSYHLAVMTVLGGVLPGRVYVDDPANPRSAILLPSSAHRIYVSGLPQPDMLGDVLRMLLQESHKESYGCVLYYASDAWQHPLEHLLQKQETFSGRRHFYRLREPSSSLSEPLPAKLSKPLPVNIAIGSIEEAMVTDSLLENRNLLRQEILSESPSLEHFFRHNSGFAAQDGPKLVAWCLAEYHYQSRYELGIETIEAYQRQGIATHLAASVIRQAFASGATEIGWHCWAANAPSVATALKLGFEKALDYPVYLCQYRHLSA